MQLRATSDFCHLVKWTKLRTKLIAIKFSFPLNYEIHQSITGLEDRGINSGLSKT